MSAIKDILKEFIGMTEEIISDQVKLLDYSFFKKYINVSLCAAILSGAGIDEDEEMEDLIMKCREVRDILSPKLLEYVAKNPVSKLISKQEESWWTGLKNLITD